MKSWWPRRKKKPLHSLFNGRVPWEHEAPEPRPPDLPPRNPRLDPHPRNAPGGFYVVNTECMTCGVPHYFAPELMDWEADNQGRPNHCFFHKQPETALEVLHAVKAVAGSCCGALRYRGSDREIMQKLKDAGCSDAIDRT